MRFSIQPDATTPIYEQIITQMVFAIARGDLSVGTLVPSVRELAGRILVHPNTVARAYQELERQGILETKRGRGMEVTPAALSLCQHQRREHIRGRLRDALREAMAGALTEAEVLELVADEWGHLNGHRPLES